MRLSGLILGVSVVAMLSVSVGEASLAEVGSAREVILRFGTPTEEKSADALESKLPQEQELTVLNQRIVAGSPPRQRSAEFSSDQLVVVAVDVYGEEITRITIPDPRLVRAEVADKSGKFIAKHTFFRKSVVFSIVLPNDPRISEIGLYHPHYTGTRFELELTARAELN